MSSAKTGEFEVDSDLSRKSKIKAHHQSTDEEPYVIGPPRKEKMHEGSRGPRKSSQHRRDH